MNFKRDFKGIYNEYLKSAIKKSFVYSILVSATVLFITSMAFWIFDVKQYWISLIVFGVLEIALFLILFSFFKPNEKVLARKLDELGLQQRVITMQQYANDDSLMARIQRQNAVEHINKVDVKLLKVVFPVVLIVFVFLAVALGAAGTTVSALSSHGVIKGGSDIIDDIIPGVINQYELSYEADGEGYIEGNFFQVVKEGEDGEPVQAIAEDGWAFSQWSDGFKDPYRQDLAIDCDLELYAIFVELDEQDQGGEGEGEGEGEPSDEDREGEPSDDKDQQQNQSDKNQDDPNGEGGGAGGKDEPHNQVIDGETYYGDSTFDNAFGDAMGNTQQNSNLSSGDKSTIEDYFKNIEK